MRSQITLTLKQMLSKFYNKETTNFESAGGSKQKYQKRLSKKMLPQYSFSSYRFTGANIKEA